MQRGRSLKDSSIRSSIKPTRALPIGQANLVRSASGESEACSIGWHSFIRRSVCSRKTSRPEQEESPRSGGSLLAPAEPPHLAAADALAPRLEVVFELL